MKDSLTMPTLKCVIERVSYSYKIVFVMFKEKCFGRRVISVTY